MVSTGLDVVVLAVLIVFDVVVAFLLQTTLQFSIFPCFLALLMKCSFMLEVEFNIKSVCCPQTLNIKRRDKLNDYGEKNFHFLGYTLIS